MKKGTLVRLTKEFKLIKHLSEHIKEFGECVGVVQGLTDYNNHKSSDPRYDPKKVGPEVDVRWQHSNLKYAYDPKYLEVLTHH